MSTQKFQTAKVVSISITHFIHDIYSSFLAPLLPLIMDKLDINYFFAALLSIFQRIPTLAYPIVGIIAERTPIRWFIISTPLITAISMSLIGSSPNYVVLCILLFVMGLSSVFFHVPSPVLVKEISGNKIGRGMSFYMIGGEVARSTGPLLIMGAVSLWGLEGTWRLIPFSLMASVIIYIKFRRIDTTKSPEIDNHLKGIGKTFKRVIPVFLIIAGLTFFRQFMKSGLTTFLPTYFNDFKNESLWIGALSLALYEGAGILGTLFGGTLSDKIGRKKVLLISGFFSPIAFLLFLQTSGVIMFAMLLLVGFFQFTSSPVLLAFIQEIKSDHPSFVTSIYMMLSFGLGAITILLFGVISDHWGIQVSMNTSAIIALGAIPFIFILPCTNNNK